MNSPSTPHSSSPLKRLLQATRAHRPTMALAAMASVTNKIFDLAPPALIGAAVDSVVLREGSFIASYGFVSIEQQLGALAALTFVIWTLESIFEYWYQLLWRNLAQTIQHELRMRCYEHVQELDLAWFEDARTGTLLSTLGDDVNQLERFLDGGANDLLQVATTVLVVGLSFLWISPLLALVAITPIPFVVWGSFRFQAKIAPRYSAVRAEAGNVAAILANNLAGMTTIKAFNSERRELDRVRQASEQYKAVNAHAIRLSSAFSPLIRMVIVLGFTATLVLGGLLAARGYLAIGAYSVLVFLTQRLLWPLTRLGATVDLYHRAMASVSRIMDLIETPRRILGGAKRAPEIAERGRIQIRGLCFRYTSDALPVFENLDLDLEPGQTLGLVGTTGAGKSTLVKLLLRFYEPQSGSIELDGQVLPDYSLSALRQCFGLVSQDVYLFDGSIRENIAYGRPEASLEEIQAAAREAEAADFIEKLPKGYETRVGERGQKLSGGQRQRLSIARARLLSPPILILDEATSAVDNETEAAIQRSLDRIAKTQTMLIIAHRLSTVRKADRIAVLANGRVSEQGTHEELLARKGIYSQLWAVQTAAKNESQADQACNEALKK